MPIYKRKFPCALCGKDVYYDSDRLTLSCGCGISKCSFVNLDAFIEMPKFDRKYWKSETFLIDSAKFLNADSKEIFISDRNSIIAGNENPQMVLRWILYPKDKKIQLCIAISGQFHKEKIAYNKKDVKEWKERVWIFLNSETVKKMLSFLERNPELIASWMCEE